MYLSSGSKKKKKEKKSADRMRTIPAQRTRRSRLGGARAANVDHPHATTEMNMTSCV
jgi:hypothetical protein